MIWRPIFHTRVLQLIDFISVLLSFYLSFYFWQLASHYISWRSISPPIEYKLDFWVVLPTLSLLCIWILTLLGAYSIQRFTSLSSEFKILLKATVLWLLIGSFILYMFTHIFIQRTYLIIEFVTVFGLLAIQKTSVSFLVRWIRSRGMNQVNVLVAGTGDQAKLFITTVRKKFNWGLKIVGVLTEDEGYKNDQFMGVKIVGSSQQIESVLKNKLPDEVIVAASTNEMGKFSTIIEVCLREGIQVRIISDFFEHLSKNMQFDRLHGVNILSVNPVERSELQIYIKRAIDIVGSCVALTIFFPIMVVAAIGIIITDGVPVFYQWRVVGLNKKPFKSWKFRTMVRDADKLKEHFKDINEMNGPVFKLTQDPRIIPFGRWLRRYSIDETPQLFSVLKGDMSLVGPRPAGPHELDRYESWHRRKLSIKPGITCLWQVNGRNSINDFNEWVRLDLEYIDNWSVLLDMKIIIKTILTIFKATGK